jgi:beta-galactosidase
LNVPFILAFPGNELDDSMGFDQVKVLGPGVVAAMVLFALQPQPLAAAADGVSSTRQLQSDWRFAKGDHPGAEAVDFDDSSWATVRVPHDWAIAGPFDPKEDGYAAKLPWRGVGWYRRAFTLDCKKGDRVYLDFDGVMAFPEVYVNGKLAGKWDYGYTSFRIDATPFVNRQGRNIVAVRADTTNHGTRWYPGAGIYRKVALEVRNPIHIAHWGTVVTTPTLEKDAAEIKVRTTIENHTKSDAKIGVLFTIRDSNGAKRGTSGDRYTVAAAGSVDVESSTSLKNYKRWDIDDPALYTLETAVLPEDAFAIDGSAELSNALDRESTTFGIRDFEFTADDGFHLNGRRVQLHGVCLHHDQGPLGAAFYPRAMERQLEIMRDMGVNAIRTSHNPPAPELLELCDRMGLVVWDECFDKWDDKADRVKGEPPLQQHAERHLRSLVTRDRNHPSIVVWSIANEISAKGGRSGLTKERTAMMRDIVRKYDKTRPVGLAHHIPETAKTDIFEPLDLTGWNYGRRYATFREHYPNKPIVYSESASALSTRGFYELPLPTFKTSYSKEHQVDSYDLNSAKWSDIPDVEFALMERDSFVAGEFVWTGFDYLGEPTPFNHDAVSSYFGIVDLCGIPKDRFYLYRSYWRPDTPTVHILPHWNWPDRVGQKVPVFVYTNGDSAELLLDGKSLGIRKKAKSAKEATSTAAAGTTASYYDPINKYRLRWNDVVYEPGELTAIAYKGGKEIGRAKMRTAGPPAALRLTPDRTKLSATGDDLCYLLVEAVDQNGVLCPLAENQVRFEIAGPGEIAAVGNGNPMSLESFQSNERKLFFGKAMVIVRTVEGKPGTIRVTASSDKLARATATCEAASSSKK